MARKTRAGGYTGICLLMCFLQKMHMWIMFIWFNVHFGSLKCISFLCTFINGHSECLMDPPPSHICNIIQVIRCQRFFFLFCFFLSWQMAERLDWWIADLICISYSVYSFSFCPELFLYFMNIINSFTCFFNYSFLCSFLKKKKKKFPLSCYKFWWKIESCIFLGGQNWSKPVAQTNKTMTRLCAFT